MNRDPLFPPFDDWLLSIFAEAPRDAEWFHRDYGLGWCEERNPDRAVEYLTRLFQQPLVLEDRFSAAQIKSGLELLAFSGESGYMSTLTGQEVPWEQRATCIAAVPNLFRDLLAPRCTHFFGHLDAGLETPTEFNQLCYMWWELCPLGCPSIYPDAALLSDAVLLVLAEILLLPSPACQESALHGLGHLAYANHARVQPLIEAYLEGHRDALHPTLRSYALAARSGQVQ